jgi:hypothetical protein
LATGQAKKNSKRIKRKECKKQGHKKQGHKQDTIIKLKDTNCLDIGIFNFEFVCILVSCIF